MEYRKIIKFGNSSHVVSLPSSWLKKNNLNKGDTVFFEENGNNELIFYTRLSDKKENLKEYVINSNNRPISYITREVISSYMNNYDLIKILGKDIDKKSVEVRNIIHGLVGLEVVEQSNNQIVAKDFLNIKEISLYGMIRRADTIIKNMLNNSKECFKTDHCVSINNSDLDVNRLYYVVGRITKAAVNNPQLVKEMNLTYYDIMNIWRMLINLENFADECKRISRLLRQVKLKKTEIEELLQIYKDIESMYAESMKAFYNKDRELAYAVLEKRRPIVKRINDFLEIESGNIVVRIIEKMKNMVTNVKQISRIVVDISME